MATDATDPATPGNPESARNTTPSCAADSGRGDCAACSGRSASIREKSLVLAAVLLVWFGLLWVQNGSALVVAAVALLTFMFGCGRTRAATGLVVPALFLPFAWLLWIEYPWNDYRWQWIASWGVMPGLLPARLLVPDQRLSMYLAAAITVVWFLAAVSVIRFWPVLRWPVVIATAGAALALSLSLRGMFLM